MPICAGVMKGCHLCAVCMICRDAFSSSAVKSSTSQRGRARAPRGPSVTVCSPPAPSRPWSPRPTDPRVHAVDPRLKVENLWTGFWLLDVAWSGCILSGNIYIGCEHCDSLCKCVSLSLSPRHIYCPRNNIRGRKMSPRSLSLSHSLCLCLCHLAYNLLYI